MPNPDYWKSGFRIVHPDLELYSLQIDELQIRIIESPDLELYNPDLELYSLRTDECQIRIDEDCWITFQNSECQIRIVESHSGI